MAAWTPTNETDRRILCAIGNNARSQTSRPTENHDAFTALGNHQSNTLGELKLAEVARCIGKNWEFLAFGLGISEVQIDHIKMDNTESFPRIMKSLLTWKQDQGVNATVEHLLTAISKVRSYVTVDWSALKKCLGDGVLKYSRPCKEDSIDEPAVPIIEPSPAAKSICEALQLPVTSRVTIQGRITEVKDAKRVSVANHRVKLVRDMFLMDDSSCCKVSLWEEAMHLQVRSGDVVTLTDVCVKSFQNEKYFSSSCLTKVEIVTKRAHSPGAENRRPSEAPLTSLNDALKLNLNSRVNVYGQVVKVEAVKYVIVDGISTPIRELYLMESSSICKVSLWEKLSEIHMVNGETVKFSNLTVKEFKNKKYLTSTWNTKVEKCLQGVNKSWQF